MIDIVPVKMRAGPEHNPAIALREHEQVAMLVRFLASNVRRPARGAEFVDDRLTAI
jgi:hypothetical protein